MIYRLNAQQCRNFGVSTRREWLLTNGIGGYAMGTASEINTRRYHGQLIAATNPPAGRMVLLASVDAFIQGDGQPVGVSANQYPGAVFPDGFQYLQSFSVGKIAKWRYEVGKMAVEKSLQLHQGRNGCTIAYRNCGDQPFLLALRPLVCHKPHHENFYERLDYPGEISFQKKCSSIAFGGQTLTIHHLAAQRVPIQGWYYRFEHAREAERGLDPRDDLFCPFELRYELLPGETAVIAAGDWADVTPEPFADDEDSNSVRLQPMLEDAASRFVVRTDSRTSILAGYPWFTDWGRDTMIALPGLLLCTGRVDEAKSLLLDYASQMRNGLIPNRFVESGEIPDYNTVDATLWFVNAVYKTLDAGWDEPFARKVFPSLTEVFVRHMQGTDFGIRVDRRDGLLTQGAEGVQLTWMDAKIGDWVVTPRHGKPIEINGLWINALRCIAWIAESLGESPDIFVAAAERAEKNFDKKFWHEVRGHYLDTVDPIDASLRPNQLIPMALPFGPAKGAHASKALDTIAWHLATARGLRTLGPEESEYRGRFEGPLPELDSSYHQGTVWPWLMGPYASALVKVDGNRKEAKRILKVAKEMLVESGLGGISEVYDADEPQRPNGCPWQAWSVGEILRAWIEDVGGD
ncbi:MAG: glycogen debranching enzyme family protein [Fimbriimonadaceae bacterium]|nr:glycogen debranching enzyme family protein [Fimbriimonadaceae bacterium]